MAASGRASAHPVNEVSGVPGLGWYMAASGAVIGGIAVAIALIAWLNLDRAEGRQFAAPGRVVVDLRADDYLVWDDYKTTFEAMRYDSTPMLATTATIRVRDASGAPVATRPAGLDTVATGTTKRRALLEFRVVRPGRHEIVVEGPLLPRVLSVAPDRLMRPYIATFGAIAAVLLGFGAGFALWARAYFRRAAARKAARPAS